MKSKSKIGIMLFLLFLLTAAYASGQVQYNERINETETVRTTRIFGEGGIFWQELSPGNNLFGQSLDSITFTHSVLGIDPPLSQDAIIKRLSLKLKIVNRNGNDVIVTVDSLSIDKPGGRIHLIGPGMKDSLFVGQSILRDGMLTVTLVANSSKDDDDDDGDGDDNGDDDGDDDDGDKDDDDADHHDDYDDDEGHGDDDGKGDDDDPGHDIDKGIYGMMISRSEGDWQVSGKNTFVIKSSELRLEYDAEVITGIDDNNEMLPGTTMLGTNYPNPFNPTTTIDYALESRSHVTIQVFNIQGQVIRSLIDDERSAGGHTVEWNGRNDQGQTVASGIYFYRIVAGDYINARKMIFMK